MAVRPEIRGASARRVGLSMALVGGLGLTAFVEAPGEQQSKASQEIAISNLGSVALPHTVELAQQHKLEELSDEATTTTTTVPVTTTTTIYRARPTPTTQPRPRASMNTTYAYSGGPSGLLRRIAGCESNGSPYAPINYQALNHYSGASGGYQFTDETWGDDGGYSKAMYAPPALQDEKAREVFAARGTEPWSSSKACWG